MTRADAPGARRPRPEAGSSTIEMVILAPALVAIVLLIVAGGRVAIAHQAVTTAAADAARAASIARTQDQAGASARTAAIASLNAQDARCRSTDVRLDLTGFAAPVGTPATVTATLTCRVDLAGFLPALPGYMPITATITSPLDTYRER